MFDYFKKRYGNDEEEITQRKPKKDKIFIGMLIFLAGFIIISLVSGIRGGTLVNTDFGFRVQISDGVAMALLVIGYIIIRIRKGRNRGG